MIRNEAELTLAQECVTTLEKVLLEARRTHTAQQYAMMSKPFLLELQTRQNEILEYLMENEAPEKTAL